MSAAADRRDRDRDRAIDRLGMMIFLGSETMLFGALFGSAFALFLTHPQAVAAGSARLSLWLGGLNTAILLTSSLLVAIAVEARGRRRGWLLAGAALLGVVFLGVKAFEYRREYMEGLMPGTAHAHFDSPAHQLFMNLYFVATGLHAVHVGVGIALLATLAWRLRRGGAAPSDVLVENVGLYWHLVDAIWVLLYPILYLTRG